MKGLFCNSRTTLLTSIIIILALSGCGVVKSTEVTLAGTNANLEVTVENNVAEVYALLTHEEYDIDVVVPDSFKLNDSDMDKSDSIFGVSYSKSLTATNSYYFVLTMTGQVSTSSVAQPPAITVNSPSENQSISGIAPFTITWTTTGNDPVNVNVVDSADQTCVAKSCTNTDGSSPSGSYDVTLEEVRSMDYGKVEITVYRTTTGTIGQYLGSGTLTCTNQAIRNIIITQ